jgi:oxygen-independent coproporphyrinogen-3 oxidase
MNTAVSASAITSHASDPMPRLADLLRLPPYQAYS